MNTLIADIKRNSLDDGPGIRTLVFFKGCPLNCVWCQNPETKTPAQEIIYKQEKCQGCGECRKACKENALNFTAGGYPFDRSRCTMCGACVRACPEEALAFAGRTYKEEELVNILAKDAVFYRNTGGGVTLSGGEPGMHPAYLRRLLPLLKEQGINICMETCGQYDRHSFEESILPFLDIVYFDLKLFDASEHARFCGIGNKAILANFEALLAEKKVELLPRIPLVPGITTTDENLTALRDYLSGLSLNKVELLPYNPLWLSKLDALGLKPEYGRRTWMDPGEKGHVKEIFKGFEINVF
jgi:pyruvate formate lyase activating enzyme